MLAPLLKPEDFQRLLATRPQMRSAHFAVHHLLAEPTPADFKRRPPPTRELSTGDEQFLALSVDKGPGVSPAGLSPERIQRATPTRWLGCVVPKRLARRAVTRNLLKRQMRNAAQRHQQQMSPGLWLIRLRAAFAVQTYPSAASQALKQAAREELEGLFA